MSVLKRGLDMDVMGKHLEGKETEKHRLKWGWESVPPCMSVFQTSQLLMRKR